MFALQISGMVERPQEFTVPELINLLPSYTIPVTLVCAGAWTIHMQNRQTN